MPWGISMFRRNRAPETGISSFGIPFFKEPVAAATGFFLSPQLPRCPLEWRCLRPWGSKRLRGSSLKWLLEP